MAESLTLADLMKMGGKPATDVPGTTGNVPRSFTLAELQQAGGVDASTIGAGESALRGGAQGLTAKFGDEITGALQALGSPFTARAQALFSDTPVEQVKAAQKIDAEKAAQPDAPGFFPRYRAERDAERAANERAKAAHPTAYAGGEFGGMVLGSPVPGGGLARAVGTGAGMGALTGLGGSEADLTKGEVGGALLDTAGGGVAGAAGGALGYGAGRVLGKAVEKASAGIRKAQADSAALKSAAAQAGERTARSSLGGEAAAAHRAIREVEEIALNEGGIYSAKQVEAAKAWLANPEVLALRLSRADNLLEQAPARLSGSLQTARNALDTARKANTPEAIETAAADALRNPIGTQVVPRLKTYLSRSIPIAVGSAIGGPGGAVVGGAVAGALGRPGTSLANMMRSPNTRNALWRAVGGAAGAGKKGAEVGIPAAQRALTQDEVEALLDVLRGRDAP